MLITFKSKGAGNVLMYAEHAKPILDLLGKDVSRGVITAAEAGGAATTLEAKIAESKTAATPGSDSSDLSDSSSSFGGGTRKPVPVSFAARAYPLLEMLHAAQKNDADIFWGA